ncbi:CorA family divalent cation transporter [Streptomyces sp. NPDC001552]|uniref:CorA family divalent cation transporter n=1 Tax=Streptomyces sp. NPDC001552 TaxID=3364587 RepID=UPI003693CC4F
MVVDRYKDVADAFAGDIDSLEAEVCSPDRPVDAGRIYQLKRELLEFKRAVMPLAGALQRLSQGTFPGIPAKVATYFRDVADHHQRVSEQILSFDELLSGMLSASIAQLDVQQNADMRRISAWAALVAVIPVRLPSCVGAHPDRVHRDLPGAAPQQVAVAAGHVTRRLIQGWYARAPAPVRGRPDLP